MMSFLPHLEVIITCKETKAQESRDFCHFCEHSRRSKLEQKVSQTGCCCDGPDYVASMSWALSRETGGGYGSLGRKLNIEFNGLLWKLEDNANSTSDTEALPPASGVEPLEFLQDVRTFERNDYGYSDIVTH